MGEASNSGKTRTPFYVGDWSVDPATDRIRQGDRETKVEPRVMAVLCYLADRAGQMVTREDLERDVWTGVIVGYDALTSTIIKVRKALEDDSKNPRYIETLPKKGYRLIAEVRQEHSGTTGTSSAAGRSLLPPRFLGLPSVVLLGFALVIAIAVSVSVFFSSEGESLTDPDLPSIVVLPFKSQVKDRQQDYFSDGITEDLTTDLSKIPRLLVISRRSAFTYKDKVVDAKQVGKELKVKYLLQGSVRRSDDQIRVSAQLVDTHSGYEMWAERYDRKQEDIFELQDQLREKIISALSIALTTREREKMSRPYTRSVAAYDSFLRGQAYLVRQTRADNLLARQYFQDAMNKDVFFARAHSGLALTHANDFRFNWSKDAGESADQALRLAREAVKLDEDSPQAHWVLGYVYLFGRRDHNKAIGMGKRTVEIDPNHADGLMLLAVTYAFANQPEKAIPLVKKAMRLNPFYPSQYPSVLALANLLNGKHVPAIKAYEEAIEINPGRIQPNIYLVCAYVRAGQMDNARWQVEKIRTDFSDFKLDQWIVRQPFQGQAAFSEIVDNLRAAGL